MNRLEIKDYRPPFITETDEARWDDCTVASTLMATAAATLGETVSKPDWSHLNKQGLKWRREAIRNELPADKQTGPTSMADMRYAFGRFFPWLPAIPFYDEQRNTWSEFKAALLSGSVCVLQGNPNKVKNTKSGLRRWTNNDDYQHAIYVDRARTKKDGSVEFWVMDPLGSGTYKGQWIPEVELKQFTDIHVGTYIKANLFVRGGWRTKKRLN